MRRVDPSETEAVQALLVAMSASGPAPERWAEAGIAAANAAIRTVPDRVLAELAEVDHEWDAHQRMGPNWTALLSGYRDTLREYVERGTD